MNSITALPNSLVSSQNNANDDDEDYEYTIACASTVFLAMEDARQRQSEQRSYNRHYIVRKDLLPNPRYNTPWQHMYSTQNDRAFITTMGVDCNTFQALLQNGFAHLWDSTPIPRNDVHFDGAPRLGRRSLDAAGALGLVLHYLCSTMPESTLQEIFALVPTTVSRYLSFASSLLLRTLRSMPEARVIWPTKRSDYRELSRLIEARHPLLKGAFGFIDGLNLAVQVSDDDEIQNATYNGWLHDHFISNVFAFSPKG